MSNSRFLFVVIIAILIIGTIITVRSSRKHHESQPTHAGPALAAVSSFEEWRQFTSPLNHFQAFFPALPQHATESTIDPKTQKTRKYDMFVSQEHNGTTFMIQLISYENDDPLLAPEKVLTHIVDEMMLANPKNELTSSSEGKFQGYRSLDFSLKNPQGKIKGKAFIVNQTLYLISYISSTENFNEQEYQHFIDHFQFLPLTPVISK